MTDPLAQFTDDRAKARGMADPWANLCVFATIDDRSVPIARVVVLRDLHARLAIFVNSTSPKHRQLQNSSRCSALVYLSSLGVQYRLIVGLEQVPPDIVRRNWRDRPRIPKVMDWFYRKVHAQSSSVSSRRQLLDAYATLDAELGQSVEAPPDAVGYYFAVDEIERLELSGTQVHSRQRHVRRDEGWQTIELVP